jgi:hypothetical protein
VQNALVKTVIALKPEEQGNAAANVNALAVKKQLIDLTSKMVYN